MTGLTPTPEDGYRCAACRSSRRRTRYTGSPTRRASAASTASPARTPWSLCRPTCGRSARIGSAREAALAGMGPPKTATSDLPSCATARTQAHMHAGTCAGGPDKRCCSALLAGLTAVFCGAAYRLGCFTTKCMQVPNWLSEEWQPAACSVSVRDCSLGSSKAVMDRGNRCLHAVESYWGLARHGPSWAGNGTPGGGE